MKSDESHLRDAIRANPHDQAPRLALADLLDEAGRTEEAADERRRAVAEKAELFLYWDSTWDGRVLSNKMPIVGSNGLFAPAPGCVRARVVSELVQMLKITAPQSGQVVRLVIVIEVAETGQVETKTTFKPIDLAEDLF